MEHEVAGDATPQPIALRIGRAWNVSVAWLITVFLHLKSHLQGHAPARVFTWIAVCVVWNFVLPGALAYVVDSFTAAQVEAKIRRLPAYQGCTDDTRGSDLTGAAPKPACDLSVPVARYFSATGKAERPRIAFFGFVESRTCYCYFLATFALGVLVWRHTRRFPKPAEMAWGTGGFIFFVWGGLSCWRAWLMADASRTIFSYVHWDVSRLGFLLQEARSAFLCVLVATIWQQAESPATDGSDAAPPEPPTFDAVRLNQAADDLGTLVERRHTDSLFLGLAFFPWTLYYWSLKARWGDPRYFMSTLVWHLVWGISWWILSRTTFSAWHQFARHRARVRAAMFAAKTPPDPSSVQWLDNLKPVSTVRVAIAGAASIVTFFLPVLKAFL